MRMSVRLLVSAFIFTATACGSSTGTTYGGGSTPTCTPAGTKVCMANILFNPSALNVAAGATVTWQNADGVDHTTTSNPSNPTGCPTWDNSVLSGATSGGVSFPTSGVTCQYYCKIHATPTTGNMRATVMVQ